MEEFTIVVHNRKYNVTPLCDEDHCTRFKISNDCDYLFTLCVDDYGNWQMEKDVVALDDQLTDDIGRAIEEYDG